jgi:Zn-dependent protease with chaperone function
MTLSQERLDTLVNQLEGYARKHPDGYRLRVTLLVMLGYAYIVVLLGGMALLLFALMAVPYAILVLVGLGSLFWVKVTPPKGVRVDRAQFPQLFDEIDRLCTTLKTPIPDQVILTDDLNAAVLQAPKLGLFGWYTNYLLLGLPLMQSVSPDQFRATLAHEFGHLSGNHSRFSGWIYRVRYAWWRLSQQQGDRGSILLYPFFKWYEPFFRAYTFVLSRRDEYFADRCAAEYAGVQHAAEDLIQIYVKSAHASDIWSNIYEQSYRQENPPEHAVSTLLEQLKRAIEPESAQTWLQMSLAQKTDHEDTHPALAERLEAYGYRYTNGNQPEVPFPVEKTAAEYFLGADVSWAIAQLDTQWKDENTKFWRQQYARAQVRSQFRKHLAERAQTQTLTVEEALKLALLTAEFAGNAAAIPLLQAVVQRSPQHAIATCTLGKFLLEQGQSEGLAYLEAALRLNPGLLISSFEDLYAGLKQQGHKDLAQTYLQQFRQLLPTWQHAQKEREQITAETPFIPHALPEPEVQQITALLTRYPEIRDAFLVQHEVKHLPQSKCYVLGIVSQINRQDPIASLQSWELAEIVRQTLCLSEDVRVIPLQQGQGDLYQALRRISGSKIV